MMELAGKWAPTWSPEYDEVNKNNDTRNHPGGRSKTGFGKSLTKTKTDAFRSAKNLRKYNKVIQNHGFRGGLENMTSGSEMDPTSIPETSQERPGTTQRRHKIDLEIGSKKTFAKYAKNT